MPGGGPGRRRGARAGRGRPRRARARLAAAAEPLRRRDRDERQDDRDRAPRPRLAHRRRAGGGGGQRRHARSPRWSARSPADATVVCECSSFQLEDSEAFAPECAVLLNVTPGPPRPPPATSTPTCAPSCGSSPIRETTTSPSSTPPRTRFADRRPRRLRAAGGLLPRGRPRLSRSSLSRGGDLRRRRAPARRRRAAACSGPHNADNAMAAAAAALAMGLERDAVGDGAPHLRRRPAPAGAGRRARRRALRQRLEGDQRRRPPPPALRSFEGGVRAILGGSLKGGGFEGLVEPVSRALRCLLPDRRGRRAGSSAISSRPRRRGGASPLRAASPRRSRAAAATRAPGEVVAAVARLRELRRLPGLRGARRALPRPGRELDARPVGKVRACWARISQAMTALSLSRWPAGAQARRGAAGRVQPAAHRDPVPARLRRRDGLQRQLDDLPAGPERRQRLLPEAHRCCSAPSGLLVMRVLSLRGLRMLRPLTPLLLAASFFLLLAVLVPGIGVSANGAQRWIGARPVPDSAVGARQAGARPLRRPPARRPPADDPEHPHPGALPVGGRRSPAC